MFNVVNWLFSQNSQQSPNHHFFPSCMSLWWFTIVSLTWPFNISQTGLLGIDDSPFFYHSSEVEMCSLLVNVGETMSYSNHVNWWFISPTLFCENIPSCFSDIDVHDRFLFQSWLSHRHQPSGLRCSRCAGPRLGRTGTAWSHVAATAWLQRCCVLRPEVQRKF